MDEELFSEQTDSRKAADGSNGEGKSPFGGAGDSDYSAAANMDRYDFMNMLAEARIVDMAWIR